MPTPRRYPAGPSCPRRGASTSASGPRSARRVAVVLEGPERGRVPAGGRGQRLLLRHASPTANAGTRYRFRLDDDRTLYPDPASRFQPDGPHGPSQVVDPAAFRWTDRGLEGRRPAGAQVLYEMHVGTFTPEGTWAAAERELPELADVGITCLEVMPVADFPGRFGWGYDGVNLFAPTRLYGTPDDFRRFVDRAHALGLGVILDVVYNHLGPDGNYLKAVRPALLHRPVRDRVGRADQLRRPGRRPGPRLLPRQRRLLDRRVPPRRPAAGRHPEHLRRHSDREHILAEIGRRVRAAAEGPVDDPRQRERAAAPADRPAGRGRAGTAWTRCGTTTSTTRRWSP